jgi:hypothetical protein
MPSMARNKFTRQASPILQQRQISVLGQSLMQIVTPEIIRALTIPEPATLLLAAIAFLMLAAMRRRAETASR